MVSEVHLMSSREARSLDHTRPYSIIPELIQAYSPPDIIKQETPCHLTVSSHSGFPLRLSSEIQRGGRFPLKISSASQAGGSVEEAKEMIRGSLGRARCRTQSKSTAQAGSHLVKHTRPDVACPPPLEMMSAGGEEVLWKSTSKGGEQRLGNAVKCLARESYPCRPQSTLVDTINQHFIYQSPTLTTRSPAVPFRPFLPNPISNPQSCTPLSAL